MAALDWFGQEAVATPLPRQRPQPRAVPRRRPQRRVRSGVFWIATFAVLLAGVVALNVAVLRVNMQVSRLDRTQLELQQENAALSSNVSSALSAQRIQQAANKLGYVPAPASDTSYLDVGKK